MIATHHLITLLENATTLEEESFDVRFEEIVSLVDQENFNAATSLITTILNEGSVDIRLLMYLFYSRFIEEGVGSLKEIFPTIQTILGNYWNNLSPVTSREKHVLSGLTWLVTSIGKKLKRSEKLLKNKKSDDFWNKSVQNLTPEEIEQLIQINHNFADFVTQLLKEPSLNQYILFITKWLSNFSNMPLEPEEKTVEEPPAEPIAPPPLSKEELFSPSESMHLLLKKIAAFEQLIAKHDFEKAALISEDINTLLKSFDPALYFPKLFGRFFALSATHIDSLSQEWEGKGSIRWEALNRLYQTDLEEFIKW